MLGRTKPVAHSIWLWFLRSFFSYIFHFFICLQRCLFKRSTFGPKSISCSAEKPAFHALSAILCLVGPDTAGNFFVNDRWCHAISYSFTWTFDQLQGSGGQVSTVHWDVLLRRLRNEMRANDVLLNDVDFWFLCYRLFYYPLDSVVEYEDVEYSSR